jgi:predicted transcriptional regulator
LRRPKINREKLHELARKGVSQGQMASAFGVSQAAVSKALKDLERETTRCLTAPPTSARKSAARVIENSINAAEQLLKINKNANELLDLVMAWQRGDDVALQILESQVYMRKIRIGKEIEQVKEYRFKDPRELALKAMEAIKGQLHLQLEIFKTLYDLEAFKEFTEAFLRVMARRDPKARDEMIQELQKERLLPIDFA